MIRLRDLLSFITFGMMMVLAAGYVGSLGVRVGRPSHRIDVSMKVADTSGLVVDSNILLRGVPVGKVTDIKSSVDGATVEFYIRDQFQVPVDTDLRLENLSALGESYVALIPRTQSGPMLHDGQSIAAEAIIQPPSISELATSVVRVLNQVDPGAVERIVGEADTALPDANSVLPNLSHTSRVLRNTATDMNGRGRELLDNFQTLLRNAEWLGPVLANLTPMIRDFSPRPRELFSAIPPVVDTGGPDTLYKFHLFLGRIQKLLDDNGGDLKVVGDNFLPHIKGIAGALLNFDTGQILANMLEGLPEDGAITLHVSVPGN